MKKKRKISHLSSRARKKNITKLRAFLFKNKIEKNKIKSNFFLRFIKRPLQILNQSSKYIKRKR
jgi:hypothetical protein